MGIWSSNPGGKRGPEQDEDPMVEVDADLGLFGRISVLNLFWVGSGLRERFFVGDRIIWILVFFILVNGLSVAWASEMGLLHIDGAVFFEGDIRKDEMSFKPMLGSVIGCCVRFQ